MSNRLLNKDGKLAKLTIRAFYDPTRRIPAIGAEFTAMFNPTQYNKSYINCYAEAQGIGEGKRKLRYQNATPQTFSFDFLIDGTGASGEKVEVSRKVKEFLDVTYEYSEELQRPYYLKLFWGEEIFKCLLVSADVNYTMFRANGSPLRATIKATFKEDGSDNLIDLLYNRTSFALDRIRKIKDGDTLVALTQSVYGEISKLSKIADSNELDNLRSLPKGGTILFPSFN